MSSVQEPRFGTATALTVTALTTLASSATAGWQSAAIDNTSDLALGALIYVSATLASGPTTGDQTIYIAVYQSEDGTNYSDPATGSEGLLSRRDPSNFTLVGNISCPTGGPITYKQVVKFAPPTMPRKWGVYLNNFTGLAFTAAAVNYTPLQGQIV